MAAHTDAETERRVSLVDSLRGEWFKLPESIMRDVGPAAQTFAGLLSITDRMTFVPADKIAKRARLPLRTCNRHLASLAERGWIENRGREQTRAGIPRRTCTITITKQARDRMQPWRPLPWWACCRVSGMKPLPWSAKAVLSIIMSRLMTLASAAQREEQFDEDGLLAELSNWGFEDRFRFSLQALESATGLNRESVITGKRLLHTAGIIRWSGDNQSTDNLIPNEDFGIFVTDLPNGRCRLRVSSVAGGRKLA